MAAALVVALVAAVAMLAGTASASPAEGIQPLSKIAVHKATVEMQPSAFVEATPSLLGEQARTRAPTACARYAGRQLRLALWLCAPTLPGRPRHDPDIFTCFVVKLFELYLHTMYTCFVSQCFWMWQGEDTEWVTVKYGWTDPSDDDWIGVFSPSEFK
jgi:hypothetical protein